MRTVMVMFDSLSKAFLPCYGKCQTIAPNFSRLAAHAAIFDNCFMGSMPCMPARRELHTGRYNFLHRIWGPLEPFDDSMPEILKKNGIYTHLVTDHFHYFEEGGSWYVNSYNTWEFIRGQEGDPWKGESGVQNIPFSLRDRKESPLWRQDHINRKYMREEKDHPLARTFEAGFDFLEKNKGNDNWFLQIENFSPHEPFYCPEKYISQYGTFSDRPRFNWPPYAPVREEAKDVEHLQAQYMGLISMCDAYLGRLLDYFDANNMWDDTMLIVNVDHGLLLGEHGRYGKRTCSNYNEIASIPLFIWDPRSKRIGRRQSLVQTIDIAPTLLAFFGIQATKDMQGHDLYETVSYDKPIREYALFGLFGHEVNITDGHYVYMRAPRCRYGEKLFNYTLSPAYMSDRMNEKDLSDFEISGPFSFTKGCRVLKIKPRELPRKPFLEYEPMRDRLYNIDKDPTETMEETNPEMVSLMIYNMKKLMKENDAPKEAYSRLGLTMD